MARISTSPCPATPPSTWAPATFTLSAWIKLPTNLPMGSGSDTYPILSNDALCGQNAAQYQFELIGGSYNGLFFGVGNRNLIWTETESNTNLESLLTNGQWRLVTAVRDDDGTGRIYCDGVLVAMTPAGYFDNIPATDACARRPDHRLWQLGSKLFRRHDRRRADLHARLGAQRDRKDGCASAHGPDGHGNERHAGGPELDRSGRGGEQLQRLPRHDPRRGKLRRADIQRQQHQLRRHGANGGHDLLLHR